MVSILLSLLQQYLESLLNAFLWELPALSQLAHGAEQSTNIKIQ